MATLFPVPQFFDNSGLPLAGGKVYTYAAGTNTPKDSYTTQTAGVANANPVVLDAYGRAPIWLDGSYKIVVKDATATTTYHTLDTIKAYPETDFTGLTSSIADLNAAAALAGTAGVVVASKNVVVDASKNIATFGSLSAATLSASTSLTTPLIKDGNGVSAITIASVASQVNALTITPGVTGSPVTLSATGSDTNIGLTLTPKGSGAVKLGALTFPTADGTVNQVLRTNGSGVLAFANSPKTAYIYSQTVTAGQTITTVLPYDNTIPQNTEGDQVLTVTFTPTSATSTLMINVCIQAGSNSSARHVCAALFQDSTANALAAGVATYSPSFCHVMAAGTTSSTTFKVRVGPSAAGSVYVNKDTAGTDIFNGKSSTSIVITEFTP